MARKVRRSRPAWRHIGPLCGTVRPTFRAMGILRLSHVDVTVTDLDLATAYYTEVLGLIVVERDADSVYLKCWDEVDHHSLRLVYAPRVGFEQMSFKVEHEDDLSELENAVSRYG